MYCGNENDDASQNCSKCGNRLLDLPPHKVMPAEEIPEEAFAPFEMDAETPDIKIAEDNLGENRSESQETPLPAEPEGFFEREQWQQDVQRGQTYAAQQQYQGAFGGQSQPGYGEYAQNGYGEASQNGYGYGEQSQNGYGYGEASQNGYGYGEASQNGYGYGEQSQNGYGYGEASQNNYGYGENGQNGYGQTYGYAGQQDVQQQYGGQAYGYQQNVQQYGYPAQKQAQGGHDYGRVQPMGGGGKQLLAKARKQVRSPLLFLALLFHTAGTVLSIINIVSGNVISNLNALQATAQSVFGSSLAVRFMNGIIDVIEGMSTSIIVGVSAVLCVPGVILCLGLWLIYLQTSPSRDQISTAGYTLTKVMTILKFIGLCLLLAAGLIVSVAFVVAAGASSSVASIIVGVILLVTMVLVSVLVVMFYVQLLFCIKVIKFNVKTGADPGRISSFVPVMGILMCIFTILTMIPMSPDDILGLADKAASAAWLLFGSIWLFVYRGKVRR